MVFEIDGHDITPFIAFEGLKYSVSDLDSEETTRTLDGDLMRFRVATKVRWDVPCKPLRTSEVMQLFEWLKPGFVSLKATDLMFGLRAAQFYSNNNNISLKVSSLTDDNDMLWEGLTFPLIER